MCDDIATAVRDEVLPSRAAMEPPSVGTSRNEGVTIS
jgi:hypothetical protein